MDFTMERTEEQKSEVSYILTSMLTLAAASRKGIPDPWANTRIRGRVHARDYGQIQERLPAVCTSIFAGR